jgi:hypothetical protein
MEAESESGINGGKEAEERFHEEEKRPRTEKIARKHRSICGPKANVSFEAQRLLKVVSKVLERAVQVRGCKTFSFTWDRRN